MLQGIFKDKKGIGMKKNLLLLYILSFVLTISFLTGCGHKPVGLTWETNVGTIEMELYPWIAPKNTKNIIQLTKDGFYDNKRFHRVVNGQVIQTGGFDKGSKSMDMLDYEIEDEINPIDLRLSEELIKQYEEAGYLFNYDVRSMPLRYGTVAMANKGPNTNQSQIFIVTNPDGLQYLNGRYTPIGQVISGVETMTIIDAVETDTFDEPVEEIYIISASVH